jgi:hypothetical protein
MLAEFEAGLRSWIRSFRPDLTRIILSKQEDSIYYESSIAQLPYALIFRQELEDDSIHRAYSVPYEDDGFGGANIFTGAFAYDVSFYVNRQFSAIQLRQELFAFYGENPYVLFTLGDGTPFSLGMYNPRVRISEVRNDEDPKGALRKVEYMFTSYISVTSVEDYPEILSFKANIKNIDG